MEEGVIESSGVPGVDAVLAQIVATIRAKNADYGSALDPLANLRAAAPFGVPPWLAAVIRANDKMLRIQSFCRNGRLRNEPLEDSLLDAAVYFMLALVLYRERYPDPEPDDGH